MCVRIRVINSTIIISSTHFISKKESSEREDCGKRHGDNHASYQKMRKIRCFLIGESKRKKERGKSSGTISSLQRYVFFETADLFLRMTMSLVSLLLFFLSVPFLLFLCVF